MPPKRDPNKPKATHKTKKKTVGGFYAEFKRWDSRGKSYAQLKEMIEDMRKALIHQSVRIRKHKAVIHFKQEDKSRIHRNDRLKIYSRNRRIEKREEEIAQLKKELRAGEVREQRLQEKVSLRELRIRNLTKEKNKVERELTKRKEKPSTLKVSASVKRLQRILDKPLSDKDINYADFGVKTALFLLDNNLTHQQLLLILQVGLCNGIKTDELARISTTVLKGTRELGYIKSNFLGADRKMHYHYLTTDGEKVFNDYKNYLSYGKGLTYE